MTHTEILTKLCAYDKRNPNHIQDERQTNCSCDNCFYGRTRLAEQLLKMHNAVKEFVDKREIHDKSDIYPTYPEMMKFKSLISK
jgi:hypothetical protein